MILVGPFQFRIFCHSQIHGAQFPTKTNFPSGPTAATENGFSLVSGIFWRSSFCLGFFALQHRRKANCTLLCLIPKKTQNREGERPPLPKSLQKQSRAAPRGSEGQEQSQG